MSNVSFNLDRWDRAELDHSEASFAVPFLKSGPADTNVNVNTLQSITMVNLEVLINEVRNETRSDVAKTLVDIRR